MLCFTTGVWRGRPRSRLLTLCSRGTNWLYERSTHPVLTSDPHSRPLVEFKIKGRGRGRPRHTLPSGRTCVFVGMVREIHRATSTATAADRACPERSRRECPPHTRLTACFSGVI